MALFAALGTGLKVGGKVVGSIINRAKEKRAQKKAAKAAQKAAAAEQYVGGALLQKIQNVTSGSSGSAEVGASVVEVKSGAARQIRKVMKFPPFVWVVAALVLLFFVFKKRK